MTRRATGTRSSRGAKKLWCVDCLAEGVTRHRPSTRRPGPRCDTHRKRKRRQTSTRRKAAHVEKHFTISAEEYDALLEAQGGVCYICHKKPGKKRLSVDHDHKMPCCGTEHEPEKGCRKCIRGLLHSKCNSFLGWTLDDPAAWERGADYLRNPPARKVLDPMRGEP